MCPKRTSTARSRATPDWTIKGTPDSQTVTPEWLPVDVQPIDSVVAKEMCRVADTEPPSRPCRGKDHAV